MFVSRTAPSGLKFHITLFCRRAKEPTPTAASSIWKILTSARNTRAKQFKMHSSSRQQTEDSLMYVHCVTYTTVLTRWRKKCLHRIPFCSVFFSFRQPCHTFAADTLPEVCDWIANIRSKLNPTVQKRTSFIRKSLSKRRKNRHSLEKQVREAFNLQ